MSVYSKGTGKKKQWRYDFLLAGERYSSRWLPTKAEAQEAEAERRRDLKNPIAGTRPMPVTPTDTDLLDLVNRRLDHVRVYNGERHYAECRHRGRRCLQRWPELACSEVSRDMVEDFIRERSMVSAQTANQELRYLRAMFNFGLKRGLISSDPTAGVDFLPVEKRLRHVPATEDIDKVIGLADADTRDYLWTVRETMARVSEVNRLTWDDVDLKNRYVVLYTRKKRGGHLTPRKVPMSDRVFEVLSSREAVRDHSKPWVFWHSRRKRDTGEVVAVPYGDRKTIMKTLCKAAGVKYFRFHALRHAGASLMEQANVPIGSIQRILGHENRTTTEIYLHSIGTAERDAVRTYERARLESHTKSHT